MNLEKNWSAQFPVFHPHLCQPKTWWDIWAYGFLTTPCLYSGPLILLSFSRFQILYFKNTTHHKQPLFTQPVLHIINTHTFELLLLLLLRSSNQQCRPTYLSHACLILHLSQVYNLRDNCLPSQVPYVINFKISKSHQSSALCLHISVFPTCPNLHLTHESIQHCSSGERRKGKCIDSMGRKLWVQGKATQGKQTTFVLVITAEPASKSQWPFLSLWLINWVSVTYKVQECHSGSWCLP